MRFNLKLEDIKYIKILYIDSQNQSNLTKAALKKIDEREILACAKFENGIDIETPQEVVLSLICNDGLYRTKTKLKSVEEDDPYVFLFLETPLGIEYQQNREYFRVKANYECVYKVNDEASPIKAKAFDISANGVSILLQNHVINDDLSKLIIKINGRDIETMVRYVRSEKIETDYRVSFAFAKISEQDRDFISQVCIQNQLVQRRNTLF